MFIEILKWIVIESLKAYLIEEAVNILRQAVNILRQYVMPQMRRLLSFFAKEVKQLRGKQPLQLLIQRKKQPLQQLKILARTVFSLMRILLDYFKK